MTCSALLLGACFDPPDAPADSETEAATGTAGETDTPSTATDPVATTDPATTTDPDTTETPETTTAGDLPPTIELMVGGSASPGPLTSSALVPLQADVTDDGTVTSVDFHQDGVLLGTDDSAPFTFEVLMTSIDAGDYEFTATATDDASQQTESDPVSLTVDIDGGGVAAVANGLFQSGGLIFQPGGGLVVDNDGNVIVQSSLSTADFEVTGLGSLSLSPDLSRTNWQISVPTSLVEGENQWLMMGQPWLSPDGSQVVMGANNLGVEGVVDPNLVLTRVATDGSGALPFFELMADPEGEFLNVGGLAQDPSGNVIMHGPDDALTKLDPATDTIVWQAPVGAVWDLTDLGGMRLRTDSEGDIIFDQMDCDFSASICDLRTSKIRGFDGVEQWNEAIPADPDNVFLHAGGSAPGPDGQVITAQGLSTAMGQGIRIVLRDDSGTTIEDYTLEARGGSTFAVADIAFDAQGYVVLVGTRFINGEQEMREAFAMRFDTEGNQVWQRSIGFGMIEDQGLALALDTQGHVLVLGMSDIDLVFFAFTGDLWVAQLDL